MAKPHAARKSIAQVIGHLGVQPKLQLGARNDPLEQEADRTAEQVVATTESELGAPPDGAHPPASPPPAPSPAPRVTPVETEAPRTSDPEPEPTEDEFISDDLSQRIARLSRGGQPLPQSLRHFMEPRFGRDFSRVRIHTDEPAADLSDAIGARAFTLGEHIAFGRNSYQPDSHSGRKLIAHELTHVVQQRGRPHTESPQPVRRLSLGDIPGVSEVADFVGDALDSAGNLIASKGWELIERYAPKLEPILRQGPLEWLKDKIGSAFDGVVNTLNQLNPGPALDELTDLFGNLLERAGTIMEALASGDCRPLFNAIGQLRSFVTEVAGNAWDKLTDFLSPVDDFFSDLWDSTGARAVDWLTEFAGDTWESIRNLGQQIWDWSQPVREAVGAAWDWIKDKLFGSGEGASEDSASGIIGWITDKAGEAWSWVKERTRPVWEPIQQGLEWLNDLIPPSFVRNLGEDMSELSQNLGQAEQQLGGDGEEQPGGDLAPNREALAGALPSLKTAMAQIREVLVDKGQWLTDKVGGLRDKVQDFFTGLRQNNILGHLSAPLSWLKTGVGRLGRWAENSVVGLFNHLVDGFDRLTPFVDHLLGVARRLIDAAGDLLQLPQLILSNVWGLIPACIRNPIKDFLVEQILSRIPVFGQLVGIPDLWERVQETAMRILRQVFVDGDIPAAAWSFFRTMLDLIGLPPELVAQVLARAAGAIGEILTDPIGFLTNTLKALGRGFTQFFANIGEHLMGGISGWLFGHMRNAGVTPPEDFSLRSVLGTVMQILDITRERIFDRLGRRIGRSTVDRLRGMLDRATGVWRFVRTLIEEGPGALWEELQQRLSNLGDRLLDSVIGWVSERIISTVSKRLTAMLDPTGIMAVVNSLIVLYQTIETFAEQLREMLEIVNRFLQGINDLAKGSLEQAANFLENAMGQSIPVVLAFLGKYAGLGNLSERIREMVESIRERVDDALDWLIDRAIRGGRALIDLARRGGRAVRRGVSAVRDWWKARSDFTTENGKSHSVYVDGRGTNARVMIASTPTNYREYIESLDTKEDKSAALDKADELDRAIANAATSDNRKDEQNDTEDTNHATNIGELVEELSVITQSLLSGTENQPSSPPIYGSRVSGFGSSVSVERLTPNHESGSSPSVSGGHWEALRRRKDGGGSYYVRGHLLNDNLGGPGSTWDNLTPLTQGANNRDSDSMLHQFEATVKKAVNEEGKTVNYIVTANYGYTHPLRETAEAHRTEDGDTDSDVIADIIHAEHYIPRSLDCRSHEIGDDGKPGDPVASHQVNNQFEDNDLDDYQLTAQPKTRLYIDRAASEGDAASLQQLDQIGPKTAKAIIDNRPDGGYRSSITLKRESGMADSQWERARNSDGFYVHIYQKGS